MSSSGGSSEAHICRVLARESTVALESLVGGLDTEEEESSVPEADGGAPSSEDHGSAESVEMDCLENVIIKN